MITKRYMTVIDGSGWTEITAETEDEADEIYNGMSKEELLEGTAWTIVTTGSYIVDDDT